MQNQAANSGGKAPSNKQQTIQSSLHSQVKPPVRVSHQHMHQQALSNISNKTGSNRNSQPNEAGLSYLQHKFTTEKRMQS